MGPIAAVPRLKGPAQIASETVLSWPLIIAAAHWDLFNPERLDGADFYVGEEEPGHIHLHGSVHLATSMALRNALIEKGYAKVSPFGGDYRHWVLFNIRTDADAEHAIQLFRLNYDRLCGVAEEKLIEAIGSR